MSTIFSGRDLSDKTNLRFAASTRWLALVLSWVAVHVLWTSWKRATGAAETWRLRRQMLGIDAALLKDIGVSDCGLEWAMRNGRETAPDAEEAGLARDAAKRRTTCL